MSVRRACRALVAAAVSALTTAVCLVSAAPPAHADVVRPIHFPVEGKVSFIDSFGAPRAGGTHQGQDLMGTKLQHELAARDGTITWVKTAGAGATSNGGNMLILRDSEGWEYWYIHINNDTPGTDDGLNPPEWMFAPGIAKGSKVVAGQFLAYMGDSGDAETTAPHLHFEIHSPDGTPINPYESLLAADTSPAAARWYLRNQPGTGASAMDIPYGTAADAPVVCNPGVGHDAIGVRHGNQLLLRTDFTAGPATTTIAFGDPTDRPLCGDWDGDGVDTPGVYRNGVFFMRNSNTSGIADRVIGYGNPGDRPVVGDWDGDGKDTIGIFRGGAFYLRNTLTTGIADVTFTYGNPDDQPFVGDWNGDGKDTIGIFRYGTWFLRNTNTTGIADQTFAYGMPADIAVVGDWNGDGVTTIGVYRP
jgi:hypothetical protein